MSLFGTSPEASDPAPKAASTSRQSLFDGESIATPAAASQSSLFADEHDDDSSPWNMPTPKKAARQELIKSLLPVADVPESYVDTYDALLAGGDQMGAGIGLTGVKKVLAAGELSADDQSRILDILLPSGAEPVEGVGRGEFNVLMALIGLAQEKEEVTLDGVDERKKRLPEPSLPSLGLTHAASASNPVGTPPPAAAPRSSATPTTAETAASKGSPAKARVLGKNTMDFPDADPDPWGSPAMHRGHNHADANGHSNGAKAGNAAASVAAGNSTPSGGQAEADSGTSNVGGGWTGYETTERDLMSHRPDSGIGGDVFAAAEADTSLPSGASTGRSLGGGIVTGGGVEETVTVTVLPDKEGMFMFQHRNYQVASARRNSKVIRRYSDFVWLLECLHLRYPFRQLPLLPPKRVAVNGNHLSSDAFFIEKRRRGLVRFTNALVRHPVLSQEQLVIMFLTVPTELAVWRKQATTTVQEEFANKTLPPTLEDSLPSSLSDTFEEVRSGVRRSADVYINLCNLMERLAKRNEGLGADYLRVALALRSVTEMTANTYAVDTNDVPLLNAGLAATAKHLSVSQSLLEDEARAWDSGVIEDFKRHRDALVSVRDMFDRAERLSKDTIPALERKIEKNEAKLKGLRQKPEGTVKPGEIEKVEEAIVRDKRSIVTQHARGVFIKECIRDELNYFQSAQYHVSRMHQDWSQERVKYAELQADNWRSLNEEVEGMPLGE